LEQLRLRLEEVGVVGLLQMCFMEHLHRQERAAEAEAVRNGQQTIVLLLYQQVQQEQEETPEVVQLILITTQHQAEAEAEQEAQELLVVMGSETAVTAA
jgi:hypothetical protein